MERKKVKRLPYYFKALSHEAKTSPDVALLQACACGWVTGLRKGGMNPHAWLKREPLISRPTEQPENPHFSSCLLPLLHEGRLLSSRQPWKQDNGSVDMEAFPTHTGPRAGSASFWLFGGKRHTLTLRPQHPNI